MNLKSIITIFLLLISISSSYGQSHKNELKINAFYAGLTIIDLQYERITLSKFSYGANFDINLRWKEFLTSFVVFGRAYTLEEAEGWFFEIHHAIHLDGTCIENQIINYIGPAFGYKALYSSNFTFELLAGVGFQYLDIDCRELPNVYFPRFGILIGKRF